MSVPQAATRHSALHRGIMLDWIRVCEDDGKPAPTDKEIAYRFGFEQIELARTLVADLSDRGSITIGHIGPVRTIRVRGNKITSRATTRAAPLRSVCKPKKEDLSVDAMVERIKNIVNPPRSAVPSVGLTGPGDTPPDWTPPHEKRWKPPLPIVRQVNIRLCGPYLDRLEQLRAADGRSLTRFATHMMERALDGDPIAPATLTPPPSPKPLVKAGIIGAAIAAGRPLHEFIEEMVELGFERWREGQGR